jgi:hypothetical protein
MKTRLLFLSALLVCGLLAACNAQPTPPPVYVTDDAEKTAILADSDVFIGDITKGIQDKDFTTYAKDFDEAMLKASTAASFDQLAAIYSPLGAPTSIELKNIQDIGDYFAVRYTVVYPEKTLVYRVVINKLDPRKVSGLWFE